MASNFAWQSNGRTSCKKRKTTRFFVNFVQFVTDIPVDFQEMLDSEKFAYAENDLCLCFHGPMLYQAKV